MRYPVTKEFSTSFASSASPTITLSDAPAGSLILCVNGDTQYTGPLTASDNAGNTYTAVILAQNTTGVSMSMFVVKKFPGGSPTITPAMQSATTGEIIVLCAAGLNVATSLASALDPNVIGTAYTGATTTIYVNQYGQCTPFIYPNNLIVNMSCSGTNGVATATGWDGLGVGQFTVLYARSGAAPGSLPSFTTIGSQDANQMLSATASFQCNQSNFQAKPKLRPYPFRPGMAR